MSTHFRNCALATLLSLSLSAQAATITIVNNDGPDEGFNDPTPVMSVGGNPGTTLGQQRLLVFQRAADIWGARLQSDVEIRVQANFDSLTCSASSATLGSAGPTTTHVVASESPYLLPAALANARTRRDLNGGRAEIVAMFNSDIDQGCLAPGREWWYGFNRAAGGDRRFALLPVVLHELAHGLGFTAMIDFRTSRFPMNVPSQFGALILDLGAAQWFAYMSPSEITAASTNDPNLVWVGLNVRLQFEDLLRTNPATGLPWGTTSRLVRLHAPATFSAGSSVSHFSTAARPNLLMEPMATPDVFDQLDLTPALLQDIGWDLMGP